VRLPALPPALALLPLRLFLGGTFVYAGIQKLTDPGFLTEGAPTYIGSQLEAFADGTPGGFLLRALALPIPEVAGVGVALFEIAVGLLAVFGLLTRVAALAGLLLSTLLFLTASWKTRPYFLGPDLVFAVAWLPFVLAGSAGQPALEHVTLRRPRVERRRPEWGEPLSRHIAGRRRPRQARESRSQGARSWRPARRSSIPIPRRARPTSLYATPRAPSPPSARSARTRAARSPTGTGVSSAPATAESSTRARAPSKAGRLPHRSPPAGSRSATAGSLPCS
jgi:thiosulfate dehydrogenase [quinone] large subunit